MRTINGTARVWTEIDDEEIEVDVLIEGALNLVTEGAVDAALQQVWQVSSATRVNAARSVAVADASSNSSEVASSPSTNM